MCMACTSSGTFLSKRASVCLNCTCHVMQLPAECVHSNSINIFPLPIHFGEALITVDNIYLIYFPLHLFGEALMCIYSGLFYLFPILL